MTLPPRLQLTYYVLIALTGLIGNVTTIFVFSQRRLRSLRSSYFLTCLAVTDLVYILILIVAFLDELDVPIMTAPMCLLTVYLSHIASFLSSNFTLAYTSHRLIAVLFPIKATTFLKQRTNRILTIALLLFACSFYSFAFSVTTTSYRSNSTYTVDCQQERDKPLLFPFLALDTLFTFLIPFSLITLMNLAIVYKLQTKLTYSPKLPAVQTTVPAISPCGKSSTNSSGQSMTDAVHPSQLNNTNGTNTASSNTHPIINESHRLLQKQQHQDRGLLSVQPVARYKGSSNRSMAVLPAHRHCPAYQTSTAIHIRSTQCRAAASAKTTKMLLAASTVFLVFNLPYHTLLFCFLFVQDAPEWMQNAVNIARLWFFASFCVNFFVYAICGQRFRSEVVRLFSCSFLRRCLEKESQKRLQQRHNSIYLSHRLLPVSLTRLSQSN